MTISGKWFAAELDDKELGAASATTEAERNALARKRDELRGRLDLPDAYLMRTDLRLLGWERRAVDAIFRECRRREGVVVLPGYSRPSIRVGVYREVIADCTYGDDRVRPT